MRPGVAGAALVGSSIPCTLVYAGIDSAAPCPYADGFWESFLNEAERGFGLVQAGRCREASVSLAGAIAEATRDLHAAHACSLGVAAAYRVLALAHVADPALTGRARLRALQVALRFMLLSSNWFTHAFVTLRYDVPLIDGSRWPITMQESVDEHRLANQLISKAGRPYAGHRPIARPIPHDYRHPSLSVGIVSLCAYPEGHMLPEFAMSNHRMYARRHGYTYLGGTERMDDGRPPAWGKVQLMQKYVKQRQWDWVMWADCDVYFMNLSVTLDSLLFRYGGVPPSAEAGELRLDPDFKFLATEDHAMLNTGIFFIRSSAWADGMLGRLWGPEDSVWTHHPWWEQAAMAWEFWGDLPERFANADHAAWVMAAGAAGDEMEGIYPRAVRIAPQFEFNSYHPVTARYVIGSGPMADAWSPGKFVIAFNGVSAGSSPTVAQELYAHYYERFCSLNSVEMECLPSRTVLPWVDVST